MPMARLIRFVNQKGVAEHYATGTQRGFELRQQRAVKIADVEYHVESIGAEGKRLFEVRGHRIYFQVIAMRDACQRMQSRDREISGDDAPSAARERERIAAGARGDIEGRTWRHQRH